MRGILLLNGEPFLGKIEKDPDTYVLCCDGAYLWAKDFIAIDENIGDFDSLPRDIEPIPKPKEIYPSEKDFSDAEIGMKHLLEMGVESIQVYGAGGKREDHFLSNLHLLLLAKERKVPCEIITNYSRIFVTSGDVVLNDIYEKTISVFPFGSEAIVTNSKGLFYKMDNLKLVYGSSRGLSNIAIQNQISFSVLKGDVLVLINHKKEVKT